MAVTETRKINSELTVSIRRMSEHDLLEVVDLEKMSGLSPWGWDAYHKELQSTEDSIMLVAHDSLNDDAAGNPHPIIGFIVARLIASELHINNVAVRPEFRRGGAGARLLWAVLNWAKQKGSEQAVLEVRAGNSTAQALYARCGFTVIGRRRRYYAAPVEDALLMAVSLRIKA